MKQYKGYLYTPDFVFRPGCIEIEGPLIRSVSYCAEAELSARERERYLLPGLVDLHFHGCAGYDFCDGTQEALEAILAYEKAHGVTTVCPATMTLPVETLLGICGTAAAYRGQGLAGIYLEGPFLSERKRGAQNPAYLRLPDPALLSALQEAAGGLIRIVAVAPELEGAAACIEQAGQSFRFSVAHTCADYQTALRAFRAGARQVTHLYNAMTPFSHREPGVAGAAADCGHVDVELICDGVHIHPGVVRSTFRLFGDDRVILISDSMRATGRKAGVYTLGGQKVYVRGNLAALEDGTLAGSVTNLYDCMCSAVSMGIPIESAVKAATRNPARAVGMDDRIGTLEAGKKADLLITDRALRLEEVVS